MFCPLLSKTLSYSALSLRVLIGSTVGVANEVQSAQVHTRVGYTCLETSLSAFIVPLK
jgi:hypothetical protein